MLARTPKACVAGSGSLNISALGLDANELQTIARQTKSTSEETKQKGLLDSVELICTDPHETSSAPHGKKILR